MDYIQPAIEQGFATCLHGKGDAGHTHDWEKKGDLVIRANPFGFFEKLGFWIDMFGSASRREVMCCGTFMDRFDARQKRQCTTCGKEEYTKMDGCISSQRLICACCGTERNNPFF